MAMVLDYEMTNDRLVDKRDWWHNELEMEGFGYMKIISLSVNSYLYEL